MAKKALRICIVAYWCLSVVSIFLSETLETHLPVELQEFIAAEFAKEIGTAELLLLVAVAPLLILSIVASVGLFCFKRWAAILYLGVELIGYCMMPLLGHTVDHAITSAVSELSSLVSGLVIGIAFFSKALSPPPESNATAPGDGVQAQALDVLGPARSRF